MKTKVWAHRGASGYAPENTLEAFELAVFQGADGIELDIHLSADGEIVVAHDEKVDRVSDGSGWIREQTLAELKRLNFNRTHPEYRLARIPTLQEVYEQMRPTPLTINVELKTDTVLYPGLEEKVLALTAKYGLESRVLYSSFHFPTLARLRELDPSVKIGLLYGEDRRNVLDWAKELMANALHPEYPLVYKPGFIDTALQNGFQIHSWIVNQETDMSALQRLGVNALITNFPDRAKKVLRHP